MAFPATVSTSINIVCSRDSYSRHSPSRIYGRCCLTHNSSGHCPASGAQCWKCSHPNHRQYMCNTNTPSRPPSRRGDNQSKDRYQSKSFHRGGKNQYHNHNSSIKIHATCNPMVLSSKPYMDSKQCVVKKFTEMHWQNPSKEAEALHWHRQTKLHKS